MVMVVRCRCILSESALNGSRSIRHPISAHGSYDLEIARQLSHHSTTKPQLIGTLVGALRGTLPSWTSFIRRPWGFWMSKGKPWSWPCGLLTHGNLVYYWCGHNQWAKLASQSC